MKGRDRMEGFERGWKGLRGDGREGDGMDDSYMGWKGGRWDG